MEPGRSGGAPSTAPPRGPGLELRWVSSFPSSSLVCFLKSGPWIGRRVEEKFCLLVSILEKREFPIREPPLSRNQWQCVYQKLVLAWAGRECRKPLEKERKGRGIARCWASLRKGSGRRDRVRTSSSLGRMLPQAAPHLPPGRLLPGRVFAAWDSVAVPSVGWAEVEFPFVLSMGHSQHSAHGMQHRPTRRTRLRPKSLRSAPSRTFMFSGMTKG